GSTPDRTGRCGPSPTRLACPRRSPLTSCSTPIFARPPRGEKPPSLERVERRRLRRRSSSREVRNPLRVPSLELLANDERGPIQVREEKLAQVLAQDADHQELYAAEQRQQARHRGPPRDDAAREQEHAQDVDEVHERQPRQPDAEQD